jgi:hypothetical protein
MLDKKRSITPQKAVEILNEQGTTVTFEQAKIILDFMYNFAILSVNQLVKNINQGSDGRKKHK